MGYLAGTKQLAVPLAAFALIGFFTYLILLLWFIIRRNLQPIQYRGPLLLTWVAVAVMVRLLLVTIWSLHPDVGSCYLQVLFHNGTYTGLALGTVRLYLLLFSYKLQGERIAMQEKGAPRGPWMRNIQWARKHRVYPIALLLCVVPQIFENLFIYDASCDDVIDLKANSTFIKDGNGSYVHFPEEHADYCIYSDRCPSGSVDPDFYLYVLIFYFIIVSILAINLRVFDKDRFYINMEFRLTALWMAMYVIFDTTIQNVVPQPDLYLYTPQEFNEVAFMILYACISLAYPIQKSYVLAREAMMHTSAFDPTGTKATASKLGSRQERESKQVEEDEHDTPITLVTIQEAQASAVVAHADSPEKTKTTAPPPVVIRNNRFTLRGSLIMGGQPQTPALVNVRKLKKILREKDGLALFKKHLQLEFSVENILSWVETQRLIGEIDTSLKLKQTDDKIVKDLTNFVDMYVRESAECQVNVSSKQRIACEAALEQLTSCITNGSPPEVFEEHLKKMATCIKEIDQEVIELMAKDSFPRFINTESYKQWYQQKKNMAQSHADLKTISLAPRKE